MGPTNLLTLPLQKIHLSVTHTPFISFWPMLAGVFPSIVSALLSLPWNIMDFFVQYDLKISPRESPYECPVKKKKKKKKEKETVWSKKMLCNLPKFRTENPYDEDICPLITLKLDEIWSFNRTRFENPTEVENSRILHIY